MKRCFGHGLHYELLWAQIFIKSAWTWAASSPPSYSGQFPEVSLRLSSSVMMMFSMSFIVRWSLKAWNSTCFSSSRDSCCMSNCRGTQRSMQRHSYPQTGFVRADKYRRYEWGVKCTSCEEPWHPHLCALLPSCIVNVCKKHVCCNEMAACSPMHHRC